MARRRGGKFELEARLKGGRETARGFDEIADAEKRAGRATDEIKQKGDKLSGVFGRLTGQAKGLITSLLGLSAVKRVLDDLIRGFERIIQLRTEITQAGLSVRETALPLAAQLFAGGGLSQQQAQDLAADLVPQIARGGVSITTATQLGIAGDVNLEGGLRGAAGKRNLKTLTRLAGVAGGGALGPDEVTKLLEILATFKLTGSEQDVFTGIAQLNAAFSKARATSKGVFATGFQGPATALQIAGFTLPEALELFVQAREVEKSDIRGGETLNILARALQSAETAKLFPGGDFLKLPVQGRLAAMRQLFAENVTAEERSRLVPNIAERNVIRLGNLLGPTNVEESAGVLSKIQKADAEAELQAAIAFSQTSVGRERAVAADQAAQSERVSRKTALETQLRGVAEQRRKFLEADRQISPSFFGRFLITDEAVEEAIIARILFREGRKVGLSPSDLFPEGSGGPLISIPDKDVTAAVELLKTRVGERGGTINIDASTINMGTVVVPNAQVAPPRSGELVPGGAQ